jgi:O-antigen/teichoic acid export membrane protein
MTPGAAPPRAGDRRLWQAFARSALFNLQAEVVVNLIRVGGVVVLARTLEPRDFGQLRMLLVVGAIAALIGSAGLPEAVIQRKELASEHQTTAWWLTAPCAALVAACAAAALAGSVLNAWVGAGQWVALILILAPAAAAFAWRERATSLSLVRGADVISSTAEALAYAPYERKG